MENVPVKIIVKAPNQQFEDQTIQCELSWTIKRLKGYLSEVYPCKPVCTYIYYYKIKFQLIHIRYTKIWKLVNSFLFQFFYVLNIVYNIGIVSILNLNSSIIHYCFNNYINKEYILACILHHNADFKWCTSIILHKLVTNYVISNFNFDKKCIYYLNYFKLPNKLRAGLFCL